MPYGQDGVYVYEVSMRKWKRVAMEHKSWPSFTPPETLTAPPPPTQEHEGEAKFSTLTQVV